jgi:hypothetical protein
MQLFTSTLSTLLVYITVVRTSELLIYSDTACQDIIQVITSTDPNVGSCLDFTGGKTLAFYYTDDDSCTGSWLLQFILTLNLYSKLTFDYDIATAWYDPSCKVGSTEIPDTTCVFGANSFQLNCPNQTSSSGQS